jgi:hypothetical protein
MIVVTVDTFVVLVIVVTVEFTDGGSGRDVVGTSVVISVSVVVGSSVG